MIKLENVSKYYNTNNNVSLGLQGVSCELKSGEIVAIVGESGSGKSTFLNVITGMDTYEDGEIYFNGEETSYYSAEDLEKFRKNNIGFIFQNYNLIDSYTVLQNVMVPLILRGSSTASAKEKALEILQQVGLTKRVHHKSTKLSGGEKQRCVIARALASDSKILACDEPTGNLDSKTGKEIIELIKSVSKDRLVLIVTHNYEEIKDIVSRRIRFHDGQLVEDVELEKVMTNETTEKAKEDYKLRQRDYFKMALNNIFATPKKTFLSFIVFLVISIAVGAIYQNCYSQSQVPQRGSSSIYNNCNPDRLVVFDNSQKPLDMEAIKKIAGTSSIVDNGFYEDIVVSSEITYNYFFESNISTYAIGSLNPEKYDIKGRMPQADDEIIIGITKDYLNYLPIKPLESSFKFNTRGVKDSQRVFKIVGFFQYYDNQADEDVYVYSNDSGNKWIKDIIQKAAKTEFDINFDTTTMKNIGYAIDNSLALGTIKLYGNSPWLKQFDASKTSIVQNTLVYSRIFEGTHILVEYDTKVKGMSVFLSQETKNKVFDDCYQATIYSSNANSLVKKLKNLGYEVHIPAKMLDSDMSVFFAKILLYFLIFISTFGVLAIYLFSYLVLSRIYASKNKDYTVIRTLGCNKKDMSNVVLYEVLTLCLSSAVLAVLIILIGNKTTNLAFFNLFDSVTVLRCLAFLVVMALFSLLVSRKFNRKLFKFSINTTLKKEALSND